LEGPSLVIERSAVLKTFCRPKLDSCVMSNCQYDIYTLLENDKRIGIQEIIISLIMKEYLFVAVKDTPKDFQVFQYLRVVSGERSTIALSCNRIM
jgi:hypothetical protein